MNVKSNEKIHGIQVLSLVSCSGAEMLWRHHSRGHRHHQGPPQVQRPWGSTELNRSSTLIHRQSLASSPSPLLTRKWILDLGVCPRLVSADSERISPWWKNKWKSEAPFTSSHVHVDLFGHQKVLPQRFVLGQMSLKLGSPWLPGSGVVSGQAVSVDAAGTRELLTVPIGWRRMTRLFTWTWKSGNSLFDLPPWSANRKISQPDLAQPPW